ncbi:hypothetical protein QBC42DRAFT_338943 [Cladorrhinum samala]|uniref:CHY-type domain-containing protein n=1 Tax=Cladorrhinum samala TaxID=585594 RepID=A0AAV9HL75_9PEZI|nr:hypothetical protein QBC42DRAFT_338943 [Cladorrhinum samala]
MIPIRSKGEPSSKPSGQVVNAAPQSRVVPKPIPEQQKQDARGYQLGQIRRRYSPKESEVNNGETSLAFNLVPSDPDFAFDLDYLECDLRVPAKYPKQPPRLLVKNSNIPRGFAINIERGWDRLVEEKKGATLLSLTNALDKRLESLLSEEKTETVKFTIFKDARHVAAEPEKPGTGNQPVKAATKPPPTQAKRPYIPEESYTKEQITEAKARRAQEVRQLEARMGRLQLFQKSSDGIIYTLPLEPRRRANLPSGLQQVKSVQLVIPLLYPLQPLRILLNDVEPEDAAGAEALEELFTQKASEQKHMSLMSHLNYLAQNMYLMAKQAQAAPAEPQTPQLAESLDTEAKEAEHSSKLETGRGHVHVIPRPPEWGNSDGSDDSDSSDYDDEDDEEEGGADLGSEPQEEPSPLPTQTAEKGTALSFPSIELHGIELLQVSILALSVKCDRCKTLNDVTGLKNNLEKSGSCKKCATAFTVRFRQELVHMNSTRAGFIDVAGCTVADMLPSTFVPTCDKCSHPAIGVISVRGETITNVCRECHARFSFKIPEVKFLNYAPGDHSRLPPTSGARRKTEKLGLHAGDPLPDRGACAHYKKSYRWFRFSCCSKVYPCDKCHDAAEEHVNEWANRMVCGWCSREQNYSVESCGFCGRSVIGRRGKGYWEGGKGTRDRRLMRRGDKRKFRRLGGSEKKD